MGAKRRREHFGAGALRLNPATSVFLNCPYDLEYQALFDSAVLSVVCCGFTPRSALESGTIAEPRMARITRAIFDSKYSIHDLSRCKGEGDANLARFNMPLELGIAMARRYLGRRAADKHDWLVMVPAGHPYGRYISDLAGFDPVTHNSTERGLIVAIMTWLATKGGRGRHTDSPTSAQGIAPVQRRNALIAKNLGAVASVGGRGSCRSQGR